MLRPRAGEGSSTDLPFVSKLLWQLCEGFTLWARRGARRPGRRLLKRRLCSSHQKGERIGNDAPSEVYEVSSEKQYLKPN